MINVARQVDVGQDLVACRESGIKLMTRYGTGCNEVYTYRVHASCGQMAAVKDYLEHRRGATYFQISDSTVECVRLLRVRHISTQNAALSQRQPRLARLQGVRETESRAPRGSR